MFKKVRHNSVWCELNHNSLKVVFTPIPCLFAPQGTITELRELFHQEVTVSAGMAAGHFRSRSRDIQIKSKTSEREAWRGRHRETEIWQGRDTKRETDRQSRKQEMMTLLRIYQT